MEIPVIDFSKLESENRGEAMALLHEACKKWGFFMIENHGIDNELMQKVKQLVNLHYEENMKGNFYDSETVKTLANNECIINKDWESTFFVWHRPNSNINELSLSKDLSKMMDAYIDQLIKLAERLSELMCENLGIQKNSIKEAFAGGRGPSVEQKWQYIPSALA
ncbi:1-aminocyclopropane-1-carboxylate oxidase 1 [Abeliophyllum distichum]|uniref:1-aminocyclopropane-1-carboxylate oxidase 1 n=1 Tax=Abeliophyllum distichum TaxID=126358 RepID=A0ABD1NW10_9LAMI